MQLISILSCYLGLVILKNSVIDHVCFTNWLAFHLQQAVRRQLVTLSFHELSHHCCFLFSVISSFSFVVRVTVIIFFMAPYVIGGPLYFCPVFSFYLSSIFFFLFFSSPNLSGHRLDVYHTSTHGVALVRI